MIKQSTINQLKSLIESYETGYIANPSVRAEQRRNKHCKFLRLLLKELEQPGGVTKNIYHIAVDNGLSYEDYTEFHDVIAARDEEEAWRLFKEKNKAAFDCERKRTNIQLVYKDVVFFEA